MKEKLTYISSVTLTAEPVCGKTANGNTAKTRAAQTKRVNYVAVAPRSFVVNALESKRNSFIATIAANRHCL